LEVPIEIPLEALLNKLGDPLLGVGEFSEEDLAEILEKLDPMPEKETEGAENGNDGDF